MNRSEEDLAALLAEHVGAHHITVDGGSYIECDALGCDARWATVDYNGTQHAKHVAEVIAAAGWVKGREEWGVWFDSLAETYRRDTRTDAERAVRRGPEERRLMRRVWGVSEWEEA